MLRGNIKANAVTENTEANGGPKFCPDDGIYLAFFIAAEESLVLRAVRYPAHDQWLRKVNDFFSFPALPLHRRFTMLAKWSKISGILGTHRSALPLLL